MAHRRTRIPDDSTPLDLVYALPVRSCGKLGSAGVGVLALLVGVVVVCVASNCGLPTAKAAGCADVDVSFARGTVQPAGFGDVGQAFIDALIPQLAGKTVSTHAVDYPATWDFAHAGDGANDLSAHIQNLARNCPKTQFVLGGFSQGAVVVDVLMGSNPTGFTYDRPLPPPLFDRISAVALFGNPKHWFINGVNVELAIPPDLQGKVLDICNPGDMVCDPNGGGLGPHCSYNTDGAADRAAEFVVQRLGETVVSTPATSLAPIAPERDGPPSEDREN